jgi:hypothetical protein
MGEYDAVSASRRFSALATQIADLREQLAESRKETELLRAEVVSLSAAVKGALDAGKARAPDAPRWDGLDQAAEAGQLAALAEWVDGVLRVQYPGYPLPACWPNHREALWELGTLHAEWQRAYPGHGGGDLDRAQWWHERWLPGALGRLRKSVTCNEYSACYVTDRSERRAPRGS